MIDPIHSLAFSVQANRGVYAVLFGSGLSRSAKIPTGWEITLDLVRKLAEISGSGAESTPVEWYRERFNKEPDYSDLLDALAKTPAERQQLLRTYWEATDEEREEGAKQPTQAHRAIADLVAKGFIKVIITTNFDRLMETALADAGITPTVFSSPDQVQGALPLIHTQCCVFKVHGDYLDTRIRNTPNELDSYPPEFDSLLDRIFDEFGLIVSGWSADWDEALRRAIMRAPSRRFTTYWAIRGESSDAAKKLIAHRGAQQVLIKDADSFFTTLQQQVQSLEEFSRPHPLSTEAAVASLKRYLTKPEYRIQLSDLVSDEVERVIAAISTQKFSIQGAPIPNAETMTARVHAYESACSTLIAMAVQGGYWAEEYQYPVWQRALSMLSMRQPVQGQTYTAWYELQRYPATLLLYALGLGAIETSKIEFLSELLTITIARENHEDLPAVQILPPFCLFERIETPQMLDGMAKHHAPMNDWLHSTMRSLLKRLIPNDEHYIFIFDKLEILIALGYGHHAKRTNDWYWVPLGGYGYRHSNRERVLNEIKTSLAQFGDTSPFVKSGLIGGSEAQCSERIAAFEEFMGKVSHQWY